MAAGERSRAWLSTTQLGATLTCFARKDRGFALALAVAVVIILFCGYQILSFLLNWFRDKAGILPDSKRGARVKA